jgi:branched-chain amino acid transport system permease protein
MSTHTAVQQTMWKRNAVGISVLIIAFVLGLLLSEFWIHAFTEAMIMTLFAMSFALLYGHTGLLTFGQGAFFGIGAYGFALAMTKLNLPYVPCLLIGFVVSGIWAWLTGFLCIRLLGIYFGIMTVVVSQVTFYVIFQWYSFTGGDNGIQGLRAPGILRDPRNYYFFCLAIAFAAFLLYRTIIRSPFGLSLRCIRENIVRASSVGINVRSHIHRAFVIAGLYAGMAGMLYAVFNISISPQMADWNSSGQAVFMGILGGATHLFGPLLGGAIWILLHSFVAGFTEYWPLVIGTIVFSIMFFMPGGVMGLLIRLKERFSLKSARHT